MAEIHVTPKKDKGSSGTGWIIAILAIIVCLFPNQ
jgi:hypothetical protein